MRKLSLVALCLCALAAPVAAQQATGASVSGQTGLFSVLGAHTLPQGTWSFGLYYNNWDRLVAPVPGLTLRSPLSSDWDYDWNRLSASFGYGISDNFEISLMLPYDDYSASDINRLGIVNGRRFDRKIEASGMANPRLGAKWRLTGDAYSASSFALNAFLEPAVGDDDEGVATSDLGFGLGANWSIGNWAIGVGYRDPGDGDNFDVPEEISAGVGYAAEVSKQLDWITELAATIYNGGDSSPDDAFDLTTGGRYWFDEGKRWAVNFGLRLELNQLSDTDEHCPIGGLAGLSFFPRFKSETTRAEEAEAARQAAEVAKQQGIDAAVANAVAGAVAGANLPPGALQDQARAAAEQAARKAAEEAAAAGKSQAEIEEAARRAAEEAVKPYAVQGAVDRAVADALRNHPVPPEYQARARQAAEEAARKAAQEAAAAGKSLPEIEQAARQAANEAVRKIAEEAAKAQQPPPPREIRETIHFSPGSTRLSNIAKAKLDEVALRLKQDPGAAAEILGYSDSLGGDAANQRLSQRRAEAARDYLVKRHGLDAARIAVVGKGEADPAGDNASAEGRKENRRAVIVVRIQ